MLQADFQRRTLLCAAAVALLAVANARAQAPQAPAPQTSSQPAAPGLFALRPRPVLTASRVNEGPTLDGDVLGESIWQNATPITDFWQEQPDQGQPASERTEVRIVFDADTLYVGVVCYDYDPSSIVVSDARRDADLDETDSFRMLFDTYRDTQNGFIFGTNPAGIEYDGQVTNEGQGGGGLRFGQQMSGSGGGFNLNWDGAWRVQTKTTDIGWTAEFAIPFRTLRFPGGAGHTWGLNFQRNIRRRNERSYWAQIPRQYDLNRVSLAGSMVGVQAPVLRTLRVTPYALGNAITSGERPSNGKVPTDFTRNVGVDLKYNLTPSLALDGTVNTDFAQVEVDDQQVNLDRFSLFFPEKRPFFLENSGFFTVGNPGEADLFFSRRIGISSAGRRIPIVAGARVSGKAGRYNVGLLNMQTEETDFRDINQGVAPSNNFGVVRLSRDLPNRSSLGVLFVNRQGFGRFSQESDHNRTYSVDGRLGVRQNSVVTGFFSKTQTPCRVPACGGRADAFNVRSRTQLQRFDVNAGYQEVGDQFNPEVGFVNRRAYRKADAFLMTRFRPANFMKIQELRPHTLYRAYWGLDGMQETGFHHIDMHWQWKNGAEMHTGMNLTQEGVRTRFEIFPRVFVPPGDYRHKEANLVFFTNQGAPVSFRVTTFLGGFFGGTRRTVQSSVRARVGETFNTEISHQANDVTLPVGSFTAHLLRTSASYSFTTRAFLQALVQYNNQLDLWSMNIRFGLLQAANTGLFVVYTDMRGLYDLIPRAERTDRSFIIKFSRMFDLLH
jgi:hypothetical protein